MQSVKQKENIILGSNIVVFYVIQSNLFWEATPFAHWKWPQKGGSLKSEVASVTKYHKSFWPSGLKTEGGLCLAGAIQDRFSCISKFTKYPAMTLNQLFLTGHNVLQHIQNLDTIVLQLTLIVRHVGNEELRSFSLASWGKVGVQ